MKDKKYLINVDFPTESIAHLNPELYTIDRRCQTEIKQRADGGVVYATEEEVEAYLSNRKILTFDGKPVKNLRICKLCPKQE